MYPKSNLACHPRKRLPEWAKPQKFVKSGCFLPWQYNFASRDLKMWIDETCGSTSGTVNGNHQNIPKLSTPLGLIFYHFLSYVDLHIHRNTCTLPCVCAPRNSDSLCWWRSWSSAPSLPTFRTGMDRLCGGCYLLEKPAQALNDTYLMGQQSKPKDVGCFGTF